MSICLVKVFINGENSWRLVSEFSQESGRRAQSVVMYKFVLIDGIYDTKCYLPYKLKKIVGSNNFSAHFIKIISHYKKIGYNINVLQQTACLVVNPIMVGNFAFLFNCTPVGRTSDSMMVPT